MYYQKQIHIQIQKVLLINNYNKNLYYTWKKNYVALPIQENGIALPKIKIFRLIWIKLHIHIYLFDSKRQT